MATRPVSVQGVTSHSVTIVWHTAESTTVTVDYGRTTKYGHSARSKIATLEHAITLQRLEPGTKYYYRVRCGKESLYEGPEFHFRTTPGKNSRRFRFLVWGDSGKGNSSQYSLVPAMVKAGADFMIHAGDVIYPDGETKDFDPKYFVPYQEFLRNTPVWLTPGNHDYHTQNAKPYLDAFHLPRNNPAGDERYYSFDYGQAHFVCVDTNQEFDQTFFDWLREDLAATTTWKFVFMHHPPYSCGQHGSSHYVRNQLAALLETYDVDVVFAGHDHDYQRSHPLLHDEPVDMEMAPHFKDPRGVIYIVTGGGAGARPTSADCRFTDVAISATHFSLLDIDGTRLTLRAIDSDGSVLDMFTIDKSPSGSGTNLASASARAPARLLSNLPNPFNPLTVVRYELDEPQAVRLAIYDPAGRMVRALHAGDRPAGIHRALWDGRNTGGRRVSSGLYFVRLQVGSEQFTRKIILAK
ncbi:MAG: metallophosphoesterase [Candidatus Krumholzibacteriia bacterium]